MMRSIDRLIASRLFLQLISLLAASLVWYYIAADRGTEVVRTVTVPLEFLNVPAEMSVSSRIREVDVQVSGSRESGVSLGGGIASQVDLKGLEQGVHRRPVQALLPTGAKLVEVSPPFVELELTRMGSRLLPVRLVPPDDLPPGYRLENVMILPGEASVKGPEDGLGELENVWIMPSLEQIEAEKQITLPLSSSKGANGKDPFMIEPGQASLSFVLVRGVPRKMVPVSVETSGEPGKDFQIDAISVDPPEVEIQGPLESVGRIEEVFLGPIDVEGLTGDITMVMTLDRPADDVEFVHESQIRVKIFLARRIESRLFDRIPVRISGKSIYPGWKVDPPEVSVILEGYPSDLDAAEAAATPVDVFVDVTNLVSTRIRVPLQFRLNVKNLKISGMEPAAVTVNALTE